MVCSGGGVVWPGRGRAAAGGAVAWPGRGSYARRMDTLEIPCPTDGCPGIVHVEAEPIASGTEWEILRIDGSPQVRCTESCRSPEELYQPVKDELQAG